MENNRIIRQFYDKCAGKPVDPITQTAAVIDLDTNKNLDQILAEIKSKLTELSVVYQNIENFDLDAFKADLEAILEEYKNAFVNTDFSVLIEKINELLNEHFGTELDPVFTEWLNNKGIALESLIRKNWYDVGRFIPWYDANEDGEVTSADIAIVNNIMANQDTLENWPIADTNDNGVADLGDINLIHDYIAGLINDNLYIAKDGLSLAVHVVDGRLSLLTAGWLNRGSAEERQEIIDEILNKFDGQPGYYISRQDSTKIYALVKNEETIPTSINVADIVDMNPYVLYYDIDNNTFIYATIKYKHGNPSRNKIAVKSAIEELNSGNGISKYNWGQQLYIIKTNGDVICWADVNQDGVVDLADVDAVVKIIAGLAPNLAGHVDSRDSEGVRLIGDINADGSVNSIDIAMITHVISGTATDSEKNYIYSNKNNTNPTYVKRQGGVVFNGSQALAVHKYYSWAAPYDFDENANRIVSPQIEDSGYYLHASGDKYLITSVKVNNTTKEVLETFDVATGVLYFVIETLSFVYIDPSTGELITLADIKDLDGSIVELLESVEALKDKHKFENNSNGYLIRPKSGVAPLSNGHIVCEAISLGSSAEEINANDLLQTIKLDLTTVVLANDGTPINYVLHVAAISNGIAANSYPFVIMSGIKSNGTNFIVTIGYEKDSNTKLITMHEAS